MLTSRNLMLLAAAGSAGLLLAALGFQFLAEMAPCKLCIWQRWPHVAAVVVGLFLWLVPSRLWAWLGALAAGTSGGIGVYHAGVEQGWWEGPSTCTSGPIGGLSAEELLAQIMTAPVVRCDDIPWELFGISMAGWNAIVSFGLAALWLVALKFRD